MPRTARSSQGGYCYHVFNRGNGRQTVFHKDGDYAAFLKLLAQAGERVPVRLLAYCLMPNHFRLALWPQKDDELSAYMMWLMTAHVRRYHKHYRSSGHVWQGRFKAFPVQEDDHLLVNEPQTEAEMEAMRECLRRGRPFGGLEWTQRTAQQLGLEASLRPRGRPRKPIVSQGLFDAEAEET